MNNSKVLVVDDEVNVLNAIRRTLRKETFDITFIHSPIEAVKHLSQTPYAAILADYRMPAMKGTHLLEKAREVSPDTIRMLLTGCVDVDVAVEAINQGAVSRFIAKPWNDEELRRSVRHAVTRYEMAMENIRLHKLAEKQNIRLKKLNHELAEARKQEIEIAANIQQTLLLGPFPSKISGIKGATLTIPSQKIDGDFYDFFTFSDHCVDFILGDVMGKGVPAALLGAATKTLFLKTLNRLLAQNATHLPKPEVIVGSVHKELTKQLIELESFVTLCYARFNLKQQQMDLVDCGHTRTLHYNNNHCQKLQGKQTPLGFSPEESYKAMPIPIEVGDIFCFYSDGITEAQNQTGECFGENRLSQIFMEHSTSQPEELAKCIHQAVVNFSGSETFVDDLTCVILRIEGI